MSYPLDVASGFWNKVKQLADDGKIISIDKVKKEIYEQKDALQQWCEDNLPKTFFKETTQILTEYKQVTGWAISKSNHYLPNALAEFLHADEADAWLVAYVLADNSNRIVVTYEKSEPARRNKVKIPDACLANDIQFYNIIDMFRRLGERF